MDEWTSPCIQVLAKFGAIIPACIVLSLFYSLHFFTPLLMTFGPSGNLRGFLRGLPSILFRTQARRVMFMLSSAVLLCLIIPSTLAIVRESLGTFLGTVLTLAAGLDRPYLHTHIRPPVRLLPYHSCEPP